VPDSGIISVRLIVAVRLKNQELCYSESFASPDVNDDVTVFGAGPTGGIGYGGNNASAIL
jgi:hypothetical protein